LDDVSQESNNDSQDGDNKSPIRSVEHENGYETHETYENGYETHENGHTHYEDQDPEPEDDGDEPPPVPKRTNRKSFYDYSDYGQLQEELSLSEESDFDTSEEEK